MAYIPQRDLNKGAKGVDIVKEKLKELHDAST